MTVTIHKLEKHIGAKVHSVDITASIDDETFIRLHDVLYNHVMLVFHD